MTKAFRFDPMRGADIQMVANWAKTPRVAKWFDDPDYANELTEHLTDDRVAQWLVWDTNTPVAYLQDYRVHGWKDHPLGFLPKGARGIDMFVIHEAQMGRGLGPRVLTQHCAALFAQKTPALGIDPHPENTAAIRCYEKAGFVAHSETKTEWGPALLMVLWPGACG
jgi:aminoglycoside 6'-N-acetyltransferase